ncbi:hypothetical protein L1887_26948 [Cichorium endivia]|nr:hypothetical protein L1887_26948 [Cichorium endivia]
MKNNSTQEAYFAVLTMMNTEIDRDWSGKSFNRRNEIPFSPVSIQLVRLEETASSFRIIFPSDRSSIFTTLFLLFIWGE